MRSSPESDFLEEIRARNLEALWEVFPKLMSLPSRVRGRACLWPAREVLPLGLEAGQIWPVERGGERRVLILRNPSFADDCCATRTLYGGIQVVMPGERAPCHRHWPAAIRFILQGGQGAYTVVQGRKLPMADGDLLLTPSWHWHEHRNEGASPLLWLDVLDLPLLNLLGLNRFEPAGEAVGQEQCSPFPEGSTYHFPWQQIRPRLMELPARDPFDGAVLEYAQEKGGPTLPTFTCRVQRLPAGFHGLAHRHTSSTLYHVIEGSGFTVVEGEKMRWRSGDTLAVPSLCWHSHGAPEQDALLFSATDSPVMQALGLDWEESASDGEGSREG